MTQPLHVHQLTLRKHHLSKLTAPERNIFFLSGHILNELNSLTKVFAWCLQSEAGNESEITRFAQGVQSMIYARILAGKLWEAWDALRPTYFSSKLSISLEEDLHPDSRTALSSLKSYFGRANPIFNVRNSFAFHYSRKLGEHWEEIADNEHLYVIAGGNIGNNIHLAAEILTNMAIFRTSHPTDVEIGAQTFLNDIQIVAGHFTTFLEGISLFYLKKMLGENLDKQGQLVEIKVAQKFSEVRIPYFFTPNNKEADV